MLRVVSIKSIGGSIANVVKYLVALAQDQLTRDGPAKGPVDYYLDPDEPPGQWWGDGRHALGLEGDVMPDDLEALLDGEHPATGRPLGRAFGDRSVRAFDATFSAPKSVSVLWATATDPWVRAEVLAAHDIAVRTALLWFQRHGALTRRGTDGVDQVDTRGITVALFRQHTSRMADPQLHTHAVIGAKVQDATGKWLSLDARFLKFHQRRIGWVYGHVLRNQLTRRLGVRWGEVVNGTADILDVPEALREVFSRRTPQVAAKHAELIREWIDDHDGAEPDPKTIAWLERRAARESRPEKSHGIPAEELRAEWADRAAEVGFGPVVLPDRGPRPATPFDPDTLVREALVRVAEQGATWTRADLAGEIATLLPPDAGDSPDDALDLIDALAERAAGLCVELHPPAAAGEPTRADGRPVSEHVTDRLLTTSAVLAEERRVLAWAERFAIDPATAPAAPAPGLTNAQAVAASAVAGQGGLVLVVGPAGTGKTTTMRAAVTALHRAGRPVLGLAPSGKAADVFATETGCQAVTLAALLTAYRLPGGPPRSWQLPAGSTVIVDEAGMAATPDLDALATLAAAWRWRVTLVGDPEQLPAVGRGGMFADLCERLPAAHLDTPQRFTEEWEAEASLRLRAGDPNVAAVYADHGRVHTVHPDLVSERVARIHQRVTENGETLAITTTTASTARAINDAIQWRRHPTGRSAQLADGAQAFAGDRIATRRNDRRLATDHGQRVRNRQTWDVTAVHRNGALTVTHPDRGTVKLGAAYVARHVELGWAVTGYGNQGDTLDHSVTIIEPSTSRAGAYMGGTRGRGKNLFLVLDDTGLADPAEALAAVISKPRRGLTAHAERERLYRSQGLEPPQLAPEPDSGAAIDGPRRSLDAAFARLQEQPPPELGL